ncbi:MAG: four helix bundle protein [Planctomycetota bacterium]
MAFMFERLDVYQKSVDVAFDVTNLCQTFPKGFGFLSFQFCRAALSISANIAEGNGRFSKLDRRNFFIIARGSVQECLPMLAVARRMNLIDDEFQKKIRGDLQDLAKMLSGLIRRNDPELEKNEPPKGRSNNGATNA